MEKRVVIVDFNHLVHTYYHSQHRLSVRVVQGGQIIDKDTTIQNGCIKAIHKWTLGGRYPTAICFDRPVPARKAYWQSVFSDMQVGSGKDYKGNRSKMPDAMFEGISDCEALMRLAGVPCFAVNNYEADDLVYACVKRAKMIYPDLPIDIITNDADILPLVDDQVSVFLRSKKGTWAESSDLEKAHYIQVRPYNLQEVVEALSDFKGFYVPYNSVLLFKLLRGDSSDNYKRKEISRIFPATKYSAMVRQMEADGVDFVNIFRYSDPVYKIMYRDTNTEFVGTEQDALASPDRARLCKRIFNSHNCEMIGDLLYRYSKLTTEQVNDVMAIYNGMNLNQPYPNKDKLLERKAFVVGRQGQQDIIEWSEIDLQRALSPLQINLRLG